MTFRGVFEAEYGVVEVEEMVAVAAVAAVDAGVDSLILRTSFFVIGFIMNSSSPILTIRTLPYDCRLRFKGFAAAVEEEEDPLSGVTTALTLMS